MITCMYAWQGNGEERLENSKCAKHACMQHAANH